MLRGRGGCYKHTFYGIESHRCMETTPSLACANKCVFCWRLINHHFSLFFFLYNFLFLSNKDIIQIQLVRHGNGKRMMLKQYVKVP